VIGERGFELFSASHVGILAALGVAGILFVYFAKRFIPPNRQRVLEVGWAVYMTVQYLAERTWYCIEDGYPVREILPFHICGMSTVLTIVMLLTRNRRIYELLYFWGLAGATMAMFMPEVEYDFPHPAFLSYFTGHAFLVYGVAYMTWVHGYRPTLGSIWRMALFTNAYMLLMAGVKEEQPGSNDIT